MHVNSDYKFVIALNKTIDIGVALNAASHIALSIAAQASDADKEKMSFITYTDGNGNEHQFISGLSLIVLRGTNGELAKLLQAAQEHQANAGVGDQIIISDFIDTMTGGTYAEQLERTKNAKELVYYGVALFGKKETIDPWTKRFSLYK